MKSFIDYIVNEEKIYSLTLTRKEVDEAFEKISKKESGNNRLKVADNVFYFYLKGRVGRNANVNGRTIKVVDKFGIDIIKNSENVSDEYPLIYVTPEGEKVYTFNKEIKIGE